MGTELSVRVVDLPTVDQLRQNSVALAMLDAIVCPYWEHRYYSFNQAWAPDEQMASMRDGSGSDYFILFKEGGCVFKIFDRDAPDSARALGDLEDQLVRVMPAQYTEFLREPAFAPREETAVGWFDADAGEWRVALAGQEAGLSKAIDLLAMAASGSAASYLKWAEEYAEAELPLDAVQVIFDRVPLTTGMVERLNPDVDFNELAGDVHEIGYPIA